MGNESNIIDNRNRKMVDCVNDLLEMSDVALFAVGYFYLGGFNRIAANLSNLKEARLIIGTSSADKPAKKELAEGFERYDKLHDELRGEGRYRDARECLVESTKQSVRTQLSRMTQSIENEDFVASLADMVASGKLKVKIYTEKRLHSKAYIFAFKEGLNRVHPGEAIIGSSNLTPAGLIGNTELNNFIQNDAGYRELTEWYEWLWNESVDFDESLLEEINESWVGSRVKTGKSPRVITPYDIYMKTAYELVKDRLEASKTGATVGNKVIENLSSFQQKAFGQAMDIIDRYGGVFVSDVVGVGKSYIGAAVVKDFELISGGGTSLVVCPASLTDMWDGYKDEFDLKVEILSMSKLLVDDDPAIVSEIISKYDRCQFVLIDESHNFRNTGTQRYVVMQSFLAEGRPCCFLTATPRNKSAKDVKNQIKLFHQESKTDIDINPPDIDEFFKLIEEGERRLPELLHHLLIRRTRNHILRSDGFDDETEKPVSEMLKEGVDFEEYANGTRKAYFIIGGEKKYFPRRELRTKEYSLEDTYKGIYDKLIGYFGRGDGDDGELWYARYGLQDYVLEEYATKQPYSRLPGSGRQLRGLMRIHFFKRLESSVEAFRESVKKVIWVNKMFLKLLAEGTVWVGDIKKDVERLSGKDPDELSERDIQKIKDEYKSYDVDAFDLVSLKKHIEIDTGMFEEMLEEVEKITPDNDVKFQTLKDLLSGPPFSEPNSKQIIFTQFEDTAKYLYENLKDIIGNLAVCYGNAGNRGDVVKRFAPKQNKYVCKPDEELFTVIATDVLSEGLNLQSCDKIINYDLHWNPVRLIQRIGRIDRIGSENEVIYGYNFLPDQGVDAIIRLMERLDSSIAGIHREIGEDSPIAKPDEELNPEPMYTGSERDVDPGGAKKIYKDGNVPEDESEAYQGLNDLEIMFREMSENDPKEFERIKNLRDGIRSSLPSETRGTYFFLRAGDRHGLYIFDSEGQPIDRDRLSVLHKINCQPGTEPGNLYMDYGERLEEAKRIFVRELKDSGKKESKNLTLNQEYVKYAMRSLWWKYKGNDEKQRQIRLLEDGFVAVTNVGIERELKRLRDRDVSGDELFDALVGIYNRHKVEKILEKRKKDAEKPVTVEDVEVICGEQIGE